MRCLKLILLFLGIHDEQAPPLKNGQFDDMEPQRDSAFDLFMQKAANMPKIWEIIMCYTSGADVANCMKTCKHLRALIGQCLCSSSKFKHKMDVAATSSAITRGRTQSKFQAQFRCKKPGPFDKMCAIDHVWYYQRSETNRINFLQFNNKTGKTKESSFITKSVDSHPSFMVHPTKDPETVFVQDFYRCLYPVRISHGHAEIVPDPDKLIGDFGVRHEEKHDRPCYIRYRLFWSGNYGISTKDDVRVFITLANKDGELDRSMQLYRFNTLHFPHVIQMASNEEVHF